jgi:hypothetical protein
MNAGYQRYTFDPKEPWERRLLPALKKYLERYGITPKRAIVNMTQTDAPAIVETTVISRGWGPFQYEVDLGPMPEPEVAEPGMFEQLELAGPVPTEQAPMMETDNHEDSPMS